MIRPALFSDPSYLYPIGNTPAVSLTQDLPPEQDADILLLGCGDVRNVLFTCFVDVARKIDVTCCDIEPLVQARNVLLYSLLIDDSANLNIELIWNIYYHWKIDSKSLKLLESQAEKLLKISETVEQWHGATYGSTIRFCDAKSLACVRSYWSGFTLQGLSPPEKKQRLKQLQAAIDRAKYGGKDKPRHAGVSFVTLHAAYPNGVQAVGAVNDAANYWRDHGTLPSSKSSVLKPAHLNPALLYSQKPTLTLSCMLHPLQGIPVSVAFTPTPKGSIFQTEQKDKSHLEYVIDCGKTLFKEWASAFRRAVANKSVIRIFCGDALDFSFTLRNCQLTSTKSSLPIKNRNMSSVQLYHGDYHDGESAAPVSFDVVDTSNLVETLGPLNLIPIASSLLKYNASSCLYTELLMQRDKNLIDRLNGFFGVDVQTMSLLLGLVAPHTFTNGMNSFEEDPVILELIGENYRQTFARSRLRWRRLKGSQESGNIPYIHVEAKALANFLFQVHYAMFIHEDLDYVLSLRSSSCTAPFERATTTFYNRASFAALLSFLKTLIISDWDKCLEYIYMRIFVSSIASQQSRTTAHQEDLLLSMHNYGVDKRRTIKPTSADVRNSPLASVLPCMEDLPEQLCVTIRVPRKQLGVYTKKTPYEMGRTPAIECSFHSDTWCWYFSVVKLTFGTWCKQTTENFFPYIEEDCLQQSGTSDMFLSVMVPSKMLLDAKRHPPWVQCQLVTTVPTLEIFHGEFGTDLCFARYIMTSENVYITRFMPGMSAVPAVAIAITRQDNPTSAKITVQLEDEGSKVKSLIQCVTLESETVEALKSATVEVKFKSPFTAVMVIGQLEELEFEFPIPVSPTEYKIRIEKEPSRVKIESPLFNPLGRDAASFLFPTFLTKAPGGTVPTSWTATRIDLDVMPPIDLTDKRMAAWIVTHAGLMFSNRELKIRLSNISALDPDTNKTAKIDIRTDLKDGLFSILMHYAGLTYQQADFFALSKKNVIQTFVFPSCLRLDLVNQTVVLDAAVIPLTKTVLSDPQAERFIQELTNHDLCQVRVSEVENRAWNAMMPALVERCRTTATWKHSPDCEYILAGEVPLSKGLTEDGVSPICSCGVGKFPSGNYLQSQRKRLSDLSYMVNQYATRAAIGLIFAVPYVEDCNLKDFSGHLKHLGSGSIGDVAAVLKVYGASRSRYNEGKCVLKDKCSTCGKYERAVVKGSERGLLVCAKCRLIKYCSTECQKTDWKKHKHVCSTTLKVTVRAEDGSLEVQYVTYSQKKL